MVSGSGNETPADSADHIVFRHSPLIPRDQWVTSLEGRWEDKRTMPLHHSDAIPAGEAVPTGRFEFRDDGGVAEVYEIRPWDGRRE